MAKELGDFRRLGMNGEPSFISLDTRQSYTTQTPAIDSTQLTTAEGFLVFRPQEQAHNVSIQHIQEEVPVGKTIYDSEFVTRSQIILMQEGGNLLQYQVDLGCALDEASQKDILAWTSFYSPGEKRYAFSEIQSLMPICRLSTGQGMSLLSEGREMFMVDSEGRWGMDVSLQGQDEKHYEEGGILQGGNGLYKFQVADISSKFECLKARLRFPGQPERSLGYRSMRRKPSHSVDFIVGVEFDPLMANGIDEFMAMAVEDRIMQFDYLKNIWRPYAYIKPIVEANPVDI